MKTKTVDLQKLVKSKHTKKIIYERSSLLDPNPVVENK